MRKFLIIITATVFITQHLFGQSVDNVQAEQKANSIEVTYDLISPVEGQKYTVELYSSKDNYKFPIQFVTGDAGPGVETGKGKKIYWEIARELGGYKGELKFELRALLSYTPLKFISPKTSVFKRTQSYQLAWSGLQENPYKVELLKGNKSFGTIGDTTNPTINWKIPVSYKPGDDYAIKITDQKNSISISKTITIRRKIPLALKIGIPAAILAGATGVILATQIKPVETTTPNKELSGPPGPPQQ